MKDSVLSLVEAVRLARLELRCFRDPRCAASADWTVSRLEELLFDQSVTEAIEVLAPDSESPSIIPHMKEMDDLRDGAPWTDHDFRTLKSELEHHGNVELTARVLMRSGTVDQVREMAADLGLTKGPALVD